MAKTPTALRDLRESKSISMDNAAVAAGLSYSVYTRIEEGSGKTTAEEQENVRKVLVGMEVGTRKLTGRPFKDQATQDAVKKAREDGTSVAAAIASVRPTPVGKAAAPGQTKKAEGDDAALAKKAPARSKPKVQADKAVEPTEVTAPVEPTEQPGTQSVSSLLP